MRYNEAFINTRKESTKDADSASHDLSVRAGLVYQVSAGLYDFLPLGQRVVSRVERIVRQGMNSAGALEISMPVLQPSELWKESDRWGVYGDEMFKLKNRENREFCLGPTHEEVVCQLVRSFLSSYRQLPINLYQIGRKFRDELRPRHGVMRAREFLMKDAYSFDTDEQGLDASYDAMRGAYVSIFRKAGLITYPTSAATGEIGGTQSEEFIAPSESGEDFILIDQDKAIKTDASHERALKGVEVGHIFKLGDRYSKPMGVVFNGTDGMKRYTLMGCYGIGITRLISAVIEQNHDERGIIWPASVSPFDLELVQLGSSHDVAVKAEEIYEKLSSGGVDVLFDDRNASPGVKFKDADLIGITNRLVIGERGLREGYVEIEHRGTGNKIRTRPDSYLQACIEAVQRDSGHPR